MVRGLALGFVSALALASAASAADMNSGGLKDGPVYAPNTWTGFYVGTNSGGAVGTSKVADPFGPSIYGDTVTSSGSFGGGQIGYNYQMQRLVLGIEADADFADTSGTSTCLAFSGFYVSADCRAKTKAFGTVAGRVGYTVGSNDRTLLYGKFGAAWGSKEMTIANNNQYFGYQADLKNTTTSTKWGWTVGGGVEHALTPRWSVKAEYNYIDFGDSNAAYPRSVFYNPTTTPPILGNVAGGTTKVSDQEQVFKLGVNYHLGAAGSDWEGGYGSSLKDAPSRYLAGWNYEVGTRYWLSSGKFQWDNQIAGKINESRLTYSDLQGQSGEVFARVDAPNNFFVKGVAGLGAITSGKMNDEDWGISGAVSYTNTVSNEGNGKLGYVIADVGYDFFRGKNYKVGSFIGYSYYTQKSDTTGCVQIASPIFPCLAPGDNRLVGNQQVDWNALRIGTSADFTLGAGFHLTADAAWLPYVSFTGRDNHLLRNWTTYFDQKADSGSGVQVEAILSYDVSNRFTLGAGGRYWSMWADGNFTCTGCSAPGSKSSPSPERIATDRYGLLLQGSYKVNDTYEPLK